MCDMPKGWTLRWQDNNERFCLQLHTRYVLEKADLLSGSSLKKWFIDKFVAHPFYIRCIATTRGTLTLNGQSREITGEAICEQMWLTTAKSCVTMR